MDSTVVSTGTEGKAWGGGNQPLKSSYGKMMMWFFIVSDALTFSGFLAAYGFSRFKFIDYWPIADEVFTHVPFLHGQELPMIYVAFMTFVLIMSSVTMVLAVDAGHEMKKNKVIWYMFFTIIGGAIFVGSQAWEWATFIQGDYGAVQTKGGNILQFGAYKTIDGEDLGALSLPEVRGKELFFSAQTECSSCHVPPLFTNFKFENIGLYVNYVDTGRMRISELNQDRGKFKVPTLRNIELTAPYMHDGSVQTLEEVVDHFNSGGVGHPNQSTFVKPLSLTEQQTADLVAFLKSLTDQSFVSNSDFSEPN